MVSEKKAEFSPSKDFHKKLVSICPDFRERERAIKNIVPYTNKKAKSDEEKSFSESHT
jgi:hypothetical protein